MNLLMFSRDHAPERSFCGTKENDKDVSFCGNRTTMRHFSLTMGRNWCWSWCWSKSRSR